MELLLRNAGLTQQQIDDNSTRLDSRSQIKFLDLAATALKDDLLGFHLAQSGDLRLMGLLYYVLASSETLEEALGQGMRYSSIVNEGIALKYRKAGDASIRLEYVGISRHSERHQIEAAMVVLVRTFRQLVNRRLPLIGVRLSHRRSGDTSELKNFFGCDVTFGADVDEMAFSKSIKELPVVNADPYLNELLIKYCEQALAASTTNENSFAASVENSIAILLPHGKARVGEIAPKLGVSRRTLARRLASEGLTFAGVLQNLKIDLAKRHLADKSLSISEIAWLLGYQDVSAFTHAFKRWTGSAPRALRRSPN